MPNFLYNSIEKFNEIKYKELNTICSNILISTEKREIINIIKEDLLNNNKDISILELEILSNNIFDYICLLIKQIDIYEINNYIMYKNRLDFPECKNYNLHLLTDILLNKKLEEKYFKLINEKIIK